MNIGAHQWEYYTAGLEKGRVLAYELLSENEMLMSNDEKVFFLNWAALNDFLGRTERVVQEAPIKDDHYKVSEEIKLSIRSYEDHT